MDGYAQAQRHKGFPSRSGSGSRTAWPCPGLIPAPARERASGRASQATVAEVHGIGPMMSAAVAVFTLDKDLLVPTELARGGWGNDHVHGVAISGALGREVERARPPRWGGAGPSVRRGHGGPVKAPGIRIPVHAESRRWCATPRGSASSRSLLSQEGTPVSPGQCDAC